MSADSIHIWVPDIREGSGGIAAFSREFVRATSESFPGHTVSVFVKNDAPAANDPLRLPGIRFHTLAGVPSFLRTPAYALQGLARGLLERPVCVLATHLHFLPALRWLNKLIGAPFGGVLHGIEAWDLPAGSRVEALREADHLIAVSRFTREKAIRTYGLKPERIGVVPNTFDHARFSPGPKPEGLLRRYGLKPEHRVLLTVSRLEIRERYKGHRQVLATLPALRKELPEIRYLVVGSGDDVQSLRDEAIALGVQDLVTITGHVPGSELPEHYRLGDVFVMPSSREGFGIVFLEAMASGKPVLAGKIDGSMDALDDGRLGWLVNPSDAGAIKDAILEILLMPEGRDPRKNPDHLREEVIRLFGYGTFKQRLAGEIGTLIQPSLPETTASPQPLTAPSPAPQKLRIAVLTQLTSPYQVELFNEIAASGQCDLQVVYMTEFDPNRLWLRPDIRHPHVVVDRSSVVRREAEEHLMAADMTVFGHYTNPFAARMIWQRSSSGRPWSFWGERPGYLHLGWLGRMFRKLVLSPLHRSDAPIWGMGQYAVKGYRMEFGDRRTYYSVPYFSDLTRFQQPKKPAPPGKKRFLYSGALTRRKGIDLLAKAFLEVAQDDANAELVVMGHGPLEGPVHEMLEPISPQVKWLGFQYWDDLPAAYADAEFLCAPSRYDGWGLSVVEGLAAGLPVLGTDRTGSALELIQTGKNGWLVEAGSTEHLVRSMREALRLSDAQIAEMSHAARQSALAYSSAAGTQVFLKAAHDVIANWRSDHPTNTGGEGR